MRKRVCCGYRLHTSSARSVCRSVGHLALRGTNLVLTTKSLEVVGKLDCSKDGKCPDKGAFYEFENKKMCGAEEPVGPVDPVGPIGPIDEDDDRVCSASVRL
jgi:hypothetical protein